MTVLGKQYQVEVQLREYGRTVIHDCTFVFNPQLVKKWQRRLPIQSRFSW